MDVVFLTASMGNSVSTEDLRGIQALLVTEHASNRASFLQGCVGGRGGGRGQQAC